MYSDVRELHEGGAAHLEQKLRRAAAAAAAKPQASPGADDNAAQRQGTNNSGSSTVSGSTLVHQSGTNAAPGPSDGTQAGNPSSTKHGVESPGTDRFLILCVNGPRMARYRHLSVLPGVDDQVLFQDIRRSYVDLRRDVTRNFHPDTPVVLQILVKKIDNVWNSSQKLVTDLFNKLKLGWLVWWVGNDILFIPKCAQFVKVGARAQCPYLHLHSCLLT